MERVKWVGRRIPSRLREHNLPLVSAGVAFDAFLAFVPTPIIVVAFYGVVADVDGVVE